MPLNKLLLLLCLATLNCFAQTGEKKPLTQILSELSEKHEVKFSHIEEELKVYVIVPPAGGLPLEEKLKYIEQHTRLRFEAVTKTYYSIYNDPKMDKPLCGYLIDKETGQGIENALVAMQGVSVSALSGPDGYFTLPVLAPNSITISHVAYQPVTINPSDLYVPACPALYLEPVVTQLEEIIAVRYLASGISKIPAGGITVKPKKFGLLPGLTNPDVLQAMQQVPGIQSVDETVANINVRGGSHSENLFLWNGIRMFQTSHFFGLISAFNPLSATHINIYKNGTSAFYGESTSSLVDISTYTPVGDSCYNVIAADMVNANFLSMVRLSDKSRIHVSGRRTFTDIFTSPTFDAYHERVFQNTAVTGTGNDTEIPVNTDDEFYFYDIAAQYQYQASESTDFFINAIGLENGIDFRQESANGIDNSHLKQRDFGGSLKIKHRWDSRHESEALMYGSWYNLTSKNEAIESNQVINQENEITDKGINLQHAYHFNENTLLNFGYQFNEISVTNFDQVNIPAFSQNETKTSQTHAVVLETRYKSPSGNTVVMAGLRNNYYQKFSLFVAEPRINFSTLIMPGLTFEVSAEQKSQTLSQVITNRQDFLGIENRRWVLADDTARPVQKSRQGTLGLDYQNNGWLISAEGFYKTVKGITTDTQSFNNGLELTAIPGNYTNYGGEFLIQKNLENLYSWVSYTYNDMEYDFGSLQPSKFPGTLAFRHAVTAAVAYEKNKLNVALGAKWHTGRRYTLPTGIVPDPITPQINYGNPNGAELSDYLQVNLSASKTWIFTKKIQFTAAGSILNLLGKENRLSRYYQPNTPGNGIEAINTYSIGRTPNISIKMVF